MLNTDSKTRPDWFERDRIRHTPYAFHKPLTWKQVSRKGQTPRVIEIRQGKVIVARWTTSKDDAAIDDAVEKYSERLRDL